LINLLQGGTEGLIYGAAIAPVAVGFTLTFGVLDIANFAHGDFVTIGMYLSWWLFVTTKLDPLVSALLAIPLGFLLGWIVFSAGVERVQKSTRILQMVLTLGMLIVIENGLLFLFLGDLRGIYVPLASQVLRVGPIGIGKAAMENGLLGLGAVTLTWLLLHRTDFGLAIRACAQSELGTRLVNLPVRRTQLVALSWSLGLAMFAGALLIQVQPVYPFAGLDFTLGAFLVAVVGGLGNIEGAVAGSLLYGLLGSVLSSVINPSVANIVTLVVLIAVLAVVPEGLQALVGPRRIAAGST
jgi:branched-chain amino acid transport system permease protein